MIHPLLSLLRHVMSWPQRVLMGLVRAYRLVLSPWLGSACRFEPTCSAYALGALAQHGAVWGTALTVWRIGRCHPWCDGGHDPVPGNPPPWRGLFTRLAPQTPACGRRQSEQVPFDPSDKD